MEINWFPGHMAKSTRAIEENLKVADCVVYVLDSRAVRSCFNPTFDRLIAVPILYVLNKTDTVDGRVTDGWLKKLTSDGKCAVAVDGTDCACRKKLLAAIKQLCAETLDRQRRRGINAHIRVVVLGVPNTGKSTIINSLCGKGSLETGNRAGVTRAARWVRVDETLDVLDTPGTLYPKITDRVIGENLAIIGSVKDEVVEKTELATVLISRLNSIDGNILSCRYGKPIDLCNGVEVIAETRGFKIRGGMLDIDRAAATLLDDFRKGRLGKVALECADA